MSAVTDTLRAEFDVERYSGDDWAQALARNLWWLMVAMGVMLVVGALALASYAGVQLGELFDASGNAAIDNVGRARATQAWATGLNFLGMGFILSGITMVLVNIVRTLRDAGRDVQLSVGTNEIQKLRKPWEGQWLPHVMMAGLMALMGAFVVSIIVAVELGSMDPEALAAAPQGLSGEDLTSFGTAQAFEAWLGPLRFVGLATIFGSIVLALRVIIRTLRFQAFRVTELAEGEPPAAGAQKATQERDEEEPEVATRRPRKRKRKTRRRSRARTEDESEPEPHDHDGEELGMFHPGQAAPASGLYYCDLDDREVHLERGKTIPPCPGGSDHHFRLVEIEKA